MFEEEKKKIEEERNVTYQDSRSDTGGLSNYNDKIIKDVDDTLEDLKKKGLMRNNNGW